MQRLMTVITALVLAFAVTGPALAAKKVKIPKALCFSIDQGGNTRYMILSIKKGQKVKNMDGNIQFYTLQGVQDYDGEWAPASGIAYLKWQPPGFFPTILAQLTSDYQDFYSFEAKWDLLNQTGDVHVYTGFTSSETRYDLTDVDCKTLDPVSN